MPILEHLSLGLFGLGLFALGLRAARLVIFRLLVGFLGPSLLHLAEGKRTVKLLVRLPLWLIQMGSPIVLIGQRLVPKGLYIDRLREHGQVVLGHVDLVLDPGTAPAPGRERAPDGRHVKVHHVEDGLSAGPLPQRLGPKRPQPQPQLLLADGVVKASDRVIRNLEERVRGEFQDVLLTQGADVGLPCPLYLFNGQGRLAELLGGPWEQG